MLLLLLLRMPRLQVLPQAAAPSDGGAAWRHDAANAAWNAANAAWNEPGHASADAADEMSRRRRRRQLAGKQGNMGNITRIRPRLLRGLATIG